MADYNDDKIEFVSLDDAIMPSFDDDNDDMTVPAVTAYPSYEEADQMFEAAAKKHTDSSDSQRRTSSSSKALRKKRKKRKLLIRRITFGASALVFLICLVWLVTIFIGYFSADKIYDDSANSVFIGTGYAPKNNQDTNSTGETLANGETVGSTKTSVLMSNYDHQALVAINSDAVGYLQIPALDLLLPVVHGSDNEFYLTHAINGSSSKNGTLFIDCRNSHGIESQNTIIYGHCMKNGAMFGTLSRYNNAEFYNTDKNKYFYFYIDNKIYQYEIYSAHTTPAVSSTYTTEFSDENAFYTYFDEMAKASFYDTTAAFNPSAKTITFSTCTNDDNTRFVVQGIRMGEILLSDVDN